MSGKILILMSQTPKSLNHHIIILSNILFLLFLAYGANFDEECVPSARSPCQYDGMECNTTSTLTVPVCKCKVGYLQMGDQYNTYCQKRKSAF